MDAGIAVETATGTLLGTDVEWIALVQVGLRREDHGQGARETRRGEDTVEDEDGQQYQ